MREDCDDGPMSEYQIILEEVINVTSPKRGFRTIQHAVSTYEQTKKGLSNFYPEKKSVRWNTLSPRRHMKNI